VHCHRGRRRFARVDHGGTAVGGARYRPGDGGPVWAPGTLAALAGRVAIGLGDGVPEGDGEGARVSVGGVVALGAVVGAGGEVTSTTRGGWVGWGGCVITCGGGVAAGGAVAAGRAVSWTTVTTGVDVAVCWDPLVRFLPKSAQSTIAAMMNDPRIASIRVLKRASSRSSGPWPGGGGGADGGGGGGGAAAMFVNSSLGASTGRTLLAAVLTQGACPGRSLNQARPISRPAGRHRDSP
jgi:hypothetical protein